jgi:hypothetical protein
MAATWCNQAKMMLMQDIASLRKKKTLLRACKRLLEYKRIKMLLPMYPISNEQRSFHAMILKRMSTMTAHWI